MMLGAAGVLYKSAFLKCSLIRRANSPGASSPGAGMTFNSMLLSPILSGMSLIASFSISASVVSSS